MYRNCNIYALIDPADMQVKYVGQTVQKLNKRLSKHISDSKHKRGASAVKNWISNLDNRPIIRLLDEAEYGIEADMREKKWIDYYGFNNLLNARHGGNIHPISDEQKRKLSIISKLNSTTKKPVIQYNLDGSFVKEYSGVREAGRELGINWRHIARCCAGDRKRHGIHQWRYKDDATPVEIIAKPTPNKLLQKKNGVVIKLFNSVTEAGRELGINRKMITECCRGNKAEYKGFEWEYYI